MSRTTVLTIGSLVIRLKTVLYLKFKDWVERSYRSGELTLSDSILTNPRREKVNVVSSSSCQENVEKESQQDEGGWETYISKKTKYMMKVLLAIEGIRRKNALELEVDPRLLRFKESTEEDPSPRP